ncbi:hypothetical protein MMG00_00820 [Ignatzschineria rhizosphaerae]|uniref:Uncharacterized protein n=1 Tax=Ignatzschineria rhizosphaerae TaxID=2923279 RepID=A0ABY3X3G9_9GAMM|nr:hypothetical protein [Ignatzschineria rhizosphaerae]UNM96445.1 hypothetical protein MMG00_00820 [Ignatzschineria rhizosphaerae]
MKNLFNILTSISRRQENRRIKSDNRFNKVQSIANEYSAETPEKIQEHIFLAESKLSRIPFWRRKEMQILTEALYRAQNLIMSRQRIYEKQSTIAHAPIVLLKKKVA